jgi:hypothetical protein
MPACPQSLRASQPQSNAKCRDCRMRDAETEEEKLRMEKQRMEKAGNRGGR